ADYVKHLEQHPLDTDAREKLAILYVDHYQRLDLARDQLEQMINQPAQPARLIAHWLNLLADLEIRSGCDYDTVSQTVQRVVDLDPESPAANVARNRLAKVRLELKSKEEKQPVKLGTYEQNIGLKGRRGATSRPSFSALCFSISCAKSRSEPPFKVRVWTETVVTFGSAASTRTQTLHWLTLPSAVFTVLVSL